MCSFDRRIFIALHLPDRAVPGWKAENEQSLVCCVIKPPPSNQRDAEISALVPGTRSGWDLGLVRCLKDEAQKSRLGCPFVGIPPGLGRGRKETTIGERLSVTGSVYKSFFTLIISSMLLITKHLFLSNVL